MVLAEQDDLASHTSSASSKLIHGGLRYLEYYEFRLVREALAEREVLLKLPLDLETRARAAELSKAPLEEAAEARGQAVRARAMHRPRRVEWAILAAVMLLGLTGLVYAFQALD